MEIEPLILRPDQQDVKREIYHHIREGKNRVAVQAMTSFGKTALAASIIQDALSKGIDVLFTAPMITLVEQTLDEFYKWGIRDVGVIQADHPYKNFGMPVQICSIQSIQSIMKTDMAGWESYQKGKLLIHDETHIFHDTHKKMIDIADMPVLGLSASPWRKGLGKYYNVLVNGPDTKWLIEQGFLSPYIAYSHFVPDMTKVPMSNGDYSLKASGEKYEPKVVADIVGTWMEHAKGLKTILFAPRVLDAERFAQEFLAAGVSAVSVSGYMDNDDCYKEIERFRKGEITVICSVAKLATGFSVRDVGCIIDAQPTKSLMRHIQKYGRGLRTHPDKEKLIILDNAGNLLRNGLPDGEYPTTLHDGSEVGKDYKKKDDPLPKACIKCGFVKPPKVRICASCGFEPTAKSKLEVEQGKLVELKKTSKLTAPEKRNKNFSSEEKERFYGGLKHYGKEHGYKSGWSAMKYKEYFGVFPDKYKNAPIVEPDSGLLSWVKSRQIAYAKRKEK
jgi:superfamily II DNA or RNA helicase